MFRKAGIFNIRGDRICAFISEEKIKTGRNVSMLPGMRRNGCYIYKDINDIANYKSCLQLTMKNTAASIR